jgi:hypothetical protein
MKTPRDNIQPQSRARVVSTFFAIVLSWLGIISTWRLFAIGATVLPTILGGILCGLLYILVERLWRREGELLKRYTDVANQPQENYASSPSPRH